jgi:hypothetical protein
MADSLEGANPTLLRHRTKVAMHCFAAIPELASLAHVIGLVVHPN